jgi:histidinol-phosphatase
MFDELAWAERGHGAWLNDGQLRVSEVDAVEDATISTGNLKSLAQCAGWARLADWVAKAGRFRGYGDFYHYHLLAAGKIDAVIESDVNILDIAALSVLVEEAGGVFTDFNGRPPGLETRSVLAGNPAMHAQLLGNFEGLVP